MCELLLFSVLNKIDHFIIYHIPSLPNPPPEQSPSDRHASQHNKMTKKMFHTLFILRFYIFILFYLIKLFYLK